MKIQPLFQKKIEKSDSQLFLVSYVQLIPDEMIILLN